MNAAKSSWNDIEDEFTIENKNSHLTDKFRFFVRAGDLGWQKNRYPVISASYVDNTFSKELYQNRKFGWLFNCDLDDVICMSASDCYVTAVNCFDASLQLKMNGLSIIGFLSKEQLAHDTKCLYNVVPASFYGVYPILSPECLAQSEDFNEVVLTGDAAPSGVFVIVDDAVEPLVANELIAVSIASGVPLTLWSLHNRQIRTISTDYCIHNFERVSKILQDGSLEFEL